VGFDSNSVIKHEKNFITYIIIARKLKRIPNFYNQSIVASHSNHIVARKQFLQKVSLPMLNSLDDELIIVCHVEDAATSSRIG
jgi:hypothetical protein